MTYSSTKAWKILLDSPPIHARPFRFGTRISDRRFAIAHEIGRIVTKKDNAFASELLMPEDRVRVVAQALDNLQDMADYFAVSIDAMIYRLKTLGIVD